MTCTEKTLVAKLRYRYLRHILVLSKECNRYLLGVCDTEYHGLVCFSMLVVTKRCSILISFTNHESKCVSAGVTQCWRSVAPALSCPSTSRGVDGAGGMGIRQKSRCLLPVAVLPHPAASSALLTRLTVSDRSGGKCSL